LEWTGKAVRSAARRIPHQGVADIDFEGACGPERLPMTLVVDLASL
jgi:hypothetical protein